MTWPIRPWQKSNRLTSSNQWPVRKRNRLHGGRVSSSLTPLANQQGKGHLKQHSPDSFGKSRQSRKRLGSLILLRNNQQWPSRVRQLPAKPSGQARYWDGKANSSLSWHLEDGGYGSPHWMASKPRVWRGYCQTRRPGPHGT